MKIGDLVARTYGEGQRSTAIVIDIEDYYPLVRAKVLWCNGDIERISVRYLEVISASR